jgi:hypothetical protein
VADLDRLIRLEEFLREGQKAEGLTVILDWRDPDDESEEAKGQDDAGSAAKK